MLKKTITFTDFNGVERTNDYYFNLSEAEIVEMELGTVGTFTEKIKQIIAAQDTPTIISVFKDLILRSYGQKSMDGVQFMKSPELSKAFEQSNAYSVLFMELATNHDAAAEFVKGIIPADLAKRLNS